MQIEIRELRKNFGHKTALNIKNLRINDGDVTGLVGNNGAGKTTLFRLMLDLLKADRGCVSLTPAQSGTDGHDTVLKSINPAKSEVWKQFTGAYIDDGFLIDFLTPEEYFSFVGRVNGLPQEETNRRLEVFEGFMNGEICGQKKLIRNLSSGNKQKVGIISAMLNRPQLLVLDEPFNFLDPTSQNALKHIITDYNRKTGATILISSHNLNHTVDVSTRIALLENGVIIKDLQNTDKSAEKELEEYFNI